MQKLLLCLKLAQCTKMNILLHYILLSAWQLVTLYHSVIISSQIETAGLGSRQSGGVRFGHADVLTETSRGLWESAAGVGQTNGHTACCRVMEAVAMETSVQFHVLIFRKPFISVAWQTRRYQIAKAVGGTEIYVLGTCLAAQLDVKIISPSCLKKEWKSRRFVVVYCTAPHPFPWQPFPVLLAVSNIQPFAVGVFNFKR